MTADIAYIAARRAARELVTARLNYLETGREHGEDSQAADEGGDAYETTLHRLVPDGAEQAGDLINALASIAADVCGYFRWPSQGIDPRRAWQMFAERDAACEVRMPEGGLP